MIELRRILKSSLALAALAAVFLVIPSQSAANGTHSWKGACNTQAQSISDRVGVSCKKAKKTVRKATRTLRLLPECNGDAAVTYRGWKISGAAGRGDIITTIFIKGNKSFIVSGGGAC